MFVPLLVDCKVRATRMFHVQTKVTQHPADEADDAAGPCRALSQLQRADLVRVVLVVVGVGVEPLGAHVRAHTDIGDTHVEGPVHQLADAEVAVLIWLQEFIERLESMMSR